MDFSVPATALRSRPFTIIIVSRGMKCSRLRTNGAFMGTKSHKGPLSWLWNQCVNRQIISITHLLISDDNFSVMPLCQLADIEQFIPSSTASLGRPAPSEQCGQVLYWASDGTGWKLSNEAHRFRPPPAQKSHHPVQMPPAPYPTGCRSIPSSPLPIESGGGTHRRLPRQRDHAETPPS